MDVTPTGVRLRHVASSPLSEAQEAALTHHERMETWQVDVVSLPGQTYGARQLERMVQNTANRKFPIGNRKHVARDNLAAHCHIWLVFTFE